MKKILFLLLFGNSLMYCASSTLIKFDRISKQILIPLSPEQARELEKNEQIWQLERKTNCIKKLTNPTESLTIKVIIGIINEAFYEYEKVLINDPIKNHKQKKTKKIISMWNKDKNNIANIILAFLLKKNLQLLLDPPSEDTKQKIETFCKKHLTTQQFIDKTNFFESFIKTKSLKDIITALDTACDNYSKNLPREKTRYTIKATQDEWKNRCKEMLKIPLLAILFDTEESLVKYLLA